MTIDAENLLEFMVHFRPVWIAQLAERPPLDGREGVGSNPAAGRTYHGKVGHEL